ncbi:MAG TPA: hypothetical protein VGL77_18720, partial [Armatimonadota bacterium]
MAQFFVRYNGWTDAIRGDDARGMLTVTAADVQLVTKLPLCTPLIPMLIVLVGVLLLFGVMPLYMLFSQTAISIASPPPLLRTLFFDAFWIWMGGAYLSLFLVFLPLRRRLLTLPRREITGITLHERELLLQTATQQVVVTTPTTSDAHALATALRAGTVAPVTRPIRAGRELLFDNSGLSNIRRVTLSVRDNVVTLEGITHPSSGRIYAGLGVYLAGGILALVIHNYIPQPIFGWGLACFVGGGIGCIVVISCGKHAVRTLACSTLVGVTAIHRFLTFLAPDPQLGERRYTLDMPSPADAAALAHRLRQTVGEPWQTTVRPVITSKSNEDAAIYLYRPPLARKSTRQGQVLTDSDEVTFVGRSGLPHPWGWRLAALITLATYPYFYSLAGHLGIMSLLDAHDR